MIPPKKLKQKAAARRPSVPSTASQRTMETSLSRPDSLIERMPKTQSAARQDPVMTSSSKSKQVSSRTKPHQHHKGQRGLPRPRRRLPDLSTYSATTTGLSKHSDANVKDQQLHQLQQLHTYTSLLQNLHVRHKNQHRAQPWFKSVSALKRCLSELVNVEAELFSLRNKGARVPAKSTATATSAAAPLPLHEVSEAQLTRRTLQRESFLKTKSEHLRVRIRRVLVDTYVRVSTLIAEGEGGFANLGVVLVGVVAGVGDVVGFDWGDGGEEGEGRDGRLMQMQGREERYASGVMATNLVKKERDIRGSKGLERDRDGASDGDPVQDQDGDGDDVDMGVAVARDVVKTNTLAATSRSSDSAPKDASSKSTEQKVKANEKKKKKKNAIDDLFSGFT